MSTPEKREQEEKSLLSIGSSFKKVITVKKNIAPKNDGNGTSIIDKKIFSYRQAPFKTTEKPL